ncbi:alpha/beta fold hydrolase [Pseudofrankia saprophytica]|uniref:alpha/beta fold hydrolase n=1 Tax=Pseudofrankia saprophytica TaxID=298655 RepID=UPI000234BD14|nr:alpha/beta hydrolase [Pseudofrankia saprophytica]
MTTTSPTEEHAADIATRLGRLHVRIIGSGRPTVLWPSMFVDSHTWDRLLPHLVGRERQFFLVDGPGLGRSEPLLRQSTITEAADAALDLLRGLEVTTPVDWVGNAFGGHVGFKLAARPGVLRSLVAISAPAEPIPAGQRRQIRLLLPLLRTVGATGPVRSAVLAAMLTEAAAADDEIRRIVVESLARPTRRSLAGGVRSFILNRADVTAELADVQVPSLFVASDDRGDWSPEDAARAAELAPYASAVTVPAARTLVPLEQPRRLLEYIDEFWRTLGDVPAEPFAGGRRP